jgi:hypothetical protein
MATKPTFEAVAAFLASVWDKWKVRISDAYAKAEAAEAALKKYADSLAPGVFDEEFRRLEDLSNKAKAELEATVELAKQSIDPRQLALLFAQELLELARTGKSPIKQPKTNLAG